MLLTNLDTLGMYIYFCLGWKLETDFLKVWNFLAQPVIVLYTTFR